MDPIEIENTTGRPWGMTIKQSGKPLGCIVEKVVYISDCNLDVDHLIIFTVMPKVKISTPNAEIRVREA